MGPEIIIAYLSAPGVLLGARVVSDLLDMVAERMPVGKPKTVVQTISDLFGYFAAGRVRPAPVVVQAEEKKPT